MKGTQQVEVAKPKRRKLKLIIYIIVYGGLPLFMVLITLSVPEPWGRYAAVAFCAFYGLTMLVWARCIGGFTYEIDLKLLSIVHGWSKEKALQRTEGTMWGYSFTVWITRVMGVVFLAFSVYVALL